MATVDLLTQPLIGPLLRWRHARTALQLLLLAVAVVVVAHGFLGPDFAAGNLATVLTWVHYRGLLVVLLLAVGNVFCAGCPMVLVRDWGRRLHLPTRKWPSWLRGKWLALALFVAVLFSYEAFDLWALPRATAWLVLGYFALALLVDLVFSGASFCKHVCPVGQFNFLGSTLSPLEVRIRQQSTCDTCVTEDCIAGRTGQRGCELGLFQPAKVGNLDCTFCLDCVQACPHDNVAVASRLPGLELADARRRSSIGTLAQRTDFAALVAVFVFGALLNALAMTGPGQRIEAGLAALLGSPSDVLVLAVLFLLGLVVVPAALLGLTAAAARRMSGAGGPGASDSRAFVFGLVPFGVGMWLAHYGFHLLTGLLVVVPVTQSAVDDLLGGAWLGTPLWSWVGLRPGAVLPLQLGCLALGSLGSAGLMSLIAERSGDGPGRSAVPWIVLVFLLAAVGAWVLLQPMEMRGTRFGA